MPKPVSHQMDVYGAWIHVATTRKQWRRLARLRGLELTGKPKSLGLTEMRVHSDGSLHFAVYLDLEQLEGAELVEIVAHEAAHVSGMLLDHCEVSYDGDSEPFAYLLGWVAAWLWDGCQ